MAKRSTNFGGKRAWAKGFSASNILATMRALGMTDDEIKAVLLDMKAKQDADKQPSTPQQEATR